YLREGIKVGCGETIVAVCGGELSTTTLTGSAGIIIVIGFGNDTKMTGFTKDSPKCSGDGIGGEKLFGFEIVIVGARG
ncbi:hypothetical protein ACHAXM_000722, partial [Skeletonema potamos]